MRITDVRTVLYEYPLLRPVGDVQWAGAVRNAELAVFLATDEGAVGVGIAGPGARAAVHGLGAELVGRDPRAVAAHWERLQRLAFKAGPLGVLGNAIAALDCALWDLRAKAAGVPLWRELGADTGRVPAYASGLDAALPDADLVAYYRRMAQVHGIRAGKLKIGREPHRDLERLGLMRDALMAGAGGDEVSLMVDANEFWTPKQAVRRIAALEREHDLVWVEEPVRRDDPRGLALVSQAVRASVATGENLTAPSQFVPLFLERAADVIQVGATSTGITGSLRIAETADAFGLSVAMVNCPGRYAAHVAAVLPNHLMMEVIDAGRDAVFTTDHRLEDGCIVLGEAPGLGLTFDAVLLERATVERPSAVTLNAGYRRASDSGLAETGRPRIADG